jgi:hypothetical protein
MARLRLIRHLLLRFKQVDNRRARAARRGGRVPVGGADCIDLLCEHSGIAALDPADETSDSDAPVESQLVLVMRSWAACSSFGHCCNKLRSRGRSIKRRAGGADDATSRSPPAADPYSLY